MNDAASQPGQLLFCGFHGTEMPDDLAGLIAAGRVGGVILFARNLESPPQIRSLTTALLAAAPDDAPLLVAIDQEGGRVQRLREPWTVWPPMRRVGDCQDPAVTRRVAGALARELRDLGIALDFAPVVDVDTNPENPVIGDRSFSSDPTRVSEHAAHFITAMQEAGVAACAKHFPGHGDTDRDSHVELPSLPHSLARLRDVELPPFEAAVRAGVASIMTAHVLFPALDPNRPATLSPRVMALLREDLAYDGVVFSDDLEMQAVAKHHSPDLLVTDCLEAGIDALLVCRSALLRDQILGHLEGAPDASIERALTRVAALKAQYAAGPAPGAPSRRPPYPAHQKLAQQVTGHSRPA